MNTTDPTLLELVNLARELGKADRQLVILGEGNASAARDDGTFWVKASGSQLSAIDVSGFSRMNLDRVLDMLAGNLTDAQVAAGLRLALADPSHRPPSVETFLHALCLAEAGARWVGHTHPISVNQILCSQLGASPFLQHIFPDEIVVCGIAPAVIPYVDPGLALAKTTRDELRRFQDAQGHSPNMLLMINHGLVALGQTSKDVLNISLMADKWARILQGSYALGGPKFLPKDEAERIDNRKDEHYRRRQLSN